MRCARPWQRHIPVMKCRNHDLIERVLFASGSVELRRVTNKTDASCKQNDEQKESSIYRVEPLAHCTQST